MFVPRVPGLVSVVTPCLDAARFLREAIESVLGQREAQIEYIVVDGGSRDGSVAIARSYEPRVRVLELPGSSQARAINAGFAASRGEYFTFLNADDMLEPDALARALAALQRAEAAPYVYGDATFIDAAGEELGPYPTMPFSRAALARACFICQPATLLRATAFERAGGIDEKYESSFDYDLWVRMAMNEPPPARVLSRLARARMHGDAKTFRKRDEVFREAIAVVRSHYHYVPFSWLHAYAGYRCDGRDQFFEASPGSLKRTLSTLAMGLRENTGRRLRYCGEWASESWRLWRAAHRRRAA